MSFSIKELETISGVKAHTIRIWEQRYNFLKPSRTSTNIRTYSNEELKTLLMVALLNKYGYKISRIDSMPPEKRQQAILQLEEAEAQNEFLVNELIGCMVDLKAQEFEQILNDFIQKEGIENTIAALIFRFLEKVGVLWQTGRIIPAQEHVVSNLIRQKIISGIEHLPLPQRKEPLFLLFLPEDEFHELGLLYVFYLLRKGGYPVLYLGANVPLDDVQFVVQLKNPDCLYIHLSALPRQVRFERWVQQLAAQTKGQILLSGYVTQEYSSKIPPQVRCLHSLSEVVSHIRSL